MPMNAQPQDVNWVEKTFKSMTLEEKVGQLFIADLVAVYAHTESPAYELAKSMCGTITLVDSYLPANGNRYRCYHEPAPTGIQNSPDHLRRFWRAGSGSIIRFGGCREGARASSIHWWWRHFVALPYGDWGNGKPAFCVRVWENHRSRGASCRHSLDELTGPDVNNNPKNPIVNTRSFGEDPAQVAAMVEAYVRGLQSEKMIATPNTFRSRRHGRRFSHEASIPSVRSLTARLG